MFALFFYLFVLFFSIFFIRSCTVITKQLSLCDLFKLTSGLCHEWRCFLLLWCLVATRWNITCWRLFDLQSFLFFFFLILILFIGIVASFLFWFFLLFIASFSGSHNKYTNKLKELIHKFLFITLALSLLFYNNIHSITELSLKFLETAKLQETADPLNHAKNDLLTSFFTITIANKNSGDNF